MRDINLPMNDRRHAGRLLADKLAHYAGQANVLVLGLPRGGVPVAFEVAQALQAPLDVFVVRKLGFPGHEEYAMGAIASGGVRVMTPLQGLDVAPSEIAKVVAQEQDELVRREQLYRGERPPLSLEGRTVIVVDDELATGASMRAAVLAIRQQRPARLVVAVPVGAQDSCQALRGEADEVVCAAMPHPFRAVGLWYKDFPQTPDEQVIALLDEARRTHEEALKNNLVREKAWRQNPSPEPQAGAPYSGSALVHSLQQHLQPLNGAENDYDALLELIGPARFALLGEASHGTEAFYRERATITRHHHAPADHRERLHGRCRPSQLARRLAREPLCARPGQRRRCGIGAVGLQTLSSLDVAQHRGARFCRMAARAQHRPQSGQAGRFLRH